MTEAGVDAGQRTLADFSLHVHMNAGLFVSGSVSHGLRVATGQPVHGTFHRVHGM
jgi:hypothetical protein